MLDVGLLRMQSGFNHWLKKITYTLRTNKYFVHIRRVYSRVNKSSVY